MRRALIVLLVLIASCAWAARAEDSRDTKQLPRLIDLGSNKCIPCKKMAPILEALQKEYKGVVDIVVIDVRKNPQSSRAYAIRVIPTQIFYDRAGKEVFRHEGFFSKEQIEAVFREKLDAKTKSSEKAATLVESGGID